MKDNIIEIDLEEVEREIIEVQKQLELLNNIRTYAYSKIKKVSNSPAPSTNGNGQREVGVSDFILTLLKGNDRMGTKSIIKSYAEYVQKEEKEVSGNVSNALSRLKTKGKLNNEAMSGGKSAGSEWFLNEKKT